MGSDLTDVFNDCFARGSLSFSQRTGLITLLYKKHDRLDTKNWRPISLLCTDYKILSKVLTNRLKTVIASVISESQSFGVPRRFSGLNVRTLQDVVNYCNKQNLGVAVLSLDQEKAFDRVDWNFMLRVLEQMNFGPSFRSWVRLLYTDIFSRVLVNGHTSHAFAVSRSVRQGCPLSPLLYILVAETLSCAIKQNADIDGFLLMNGSHLKIFQYADDTCVIVRSDNALLSLFALFERYERASGAKLNVMKIHGLLFGPWQHPDDLPVELSWSGEAITVLGCRISNSESVDWESLIVKFESQLVLWKHSQLSFRGRALIANVLGLSVFWYQATVFDMPKTVIHQVNKLLFPFVWSKKREWMARSSVVQPISQSGLSIVDIAPKILVLQAVWVRRFFCDSTHPWSLFFSYHIASVFSGQSVQQVLSRNQIPAYLIKKLPLFYRDILDAWVQLRGQLVAGSWVIPRPTGQSIDVTALTVRDSYSLLRRSSWVEHRSISKFCDLGVQVSWNTTWSSLDLWRFVRSVQDTSWLSFHGILPTADRLIRFGMKVQPSCFCGAPESLVHLFVSCPFAVSVWDWFLPQFRKLEPTKVSLSTSEILFGFSADPDVPVVFTALLGILRHQIWLTRNAHRFDNTSPHICVTLKKAKSTFRFLVRMHQRHCPEDRFSREWLADGTIGCINEHG